MDGPRRCCFQISAGFTPAIASGSPPGSSPPRHSATTSPRRRALSTAPPRGPTRTSGPPSTPMERRFSTYRSRGPGRRRRPTAVVERPWRFPASSTPTSRRQARQLGRPYSRRCWRRLRCSSTGCPANRISSWGFRSPGSPTSKTPPWWPTASTPHRCAPVSTPRRHSTACSPRPPGPGSGSAARPGDLWHAGPPSAHSAGSQSDAAGIDHVHHRQDWCAVRLWRRGDRLRDFAEGVLQLRAVNQPRRQRIRNRGRVRVQPRSVRRRDDQPMAVAL